MARLDRLPDEPRRALQTASVIGREFTARLLERTDGRAPTSSPARAEAVELIFRALAHPELVFMFKHALTQPKGAAQSWLFERRSDVASGPSALSRSWMPMAVARCGRDASPRSQ